MPWRFQLLDLPSDAPRWRALCARAINPTLSHDLDFLAYHPPGRHRFAHWVAERGGKPFALLPGGWTQGPDGEARWSSPVGASVGGPAFVRAPRGDEARACLQAFAARLAQEHRARVELRLPPPFYHPRGDDPLAFALPAAGFALQHRWLVHALPTGGAPALDADHRRRLARALGAGAWAARGGLEGLDAFLDLLRQTCERHQHTPTHTDDELRDLLGRLPDKVELWLGGLGGSQRASAGVLLFRAAPHVAATAYIAAGPPSDATLVLLVHLVQDLAARGVAWLDLGPSSFSDHRPHPTLARFKEALGALRTARDLWLGPAMPHPEHPTKKMGGVGTEWRDMSAQQSRYVELRSPQSVRDAVPHVQSNPTSPSPQDDETTRLHSVAPRYADEGEVERRINRLVAEHVLQHLRAPVLELGCGEGAWTDLLVERLGALTTVDAAPALLAARKARWGERLTTHAALFEDFEPREPYAHVLLASVLHHVEDPVGLLRRVASWLGSGSLWVTVPHAGSLHRRLGVKLGALQRDTQISEQGHVFGHRRTYTRAALLDDLARAGLVSVREEGLWLKPLSNAQMEGWEPALHEAFFALGQELPMEQSAILLVECKRRDALPRSLPGPALPPDPWEALQQGPMFLMTADQDWAPPWACEAWLAAMRDHGITPHVFRTSPCPVLDAAAARGEITQGWHPNFLPGSTQGHDATAVLQSLQRLVPGATTARAHAYRDDSYLARALVEAGVRFLSHPATRFEPKLKPLQHHSGLWLLPVFYEDDVHFDLDPHALGLGPILEALDTPGLKVFDLHPTFFACNTPSRQHHELHRAAIFGSERPSEGVVWQGRGAASAALALLSQVARRSHPWYNLEALCRRTTPAR